MCCDLTYVCVHLPLLLQICPIRADYCGVFGVCGMEGRSLPQPAASSSSSSASAPLVSAFGKHLPLLHPRHAAGQPPDGRLQRLLHLHHRLHDELSDVWQMVDECEMAGSSAHVTLVGQNQYMCGLSLKSWGSNNSEDETWQGQGHTVRPELCRLG